MDADILRLILFLAGVGLILGIYFWDRHKKVNAKVHAIRKAQLEPEIAPPSDEFDEESDQRIDPSWDAALYDSGSAKSISDELPYEHDDEDDFDEELRRLGSIAHDTMQEELSVDRQESFSFTADDSRNEPDDLFQAGLPGLILQINVVASKGDFSGEDILRVTRDVELRHGDMNIFHRYASDDPKSRVVFSMASLVEPGIFPLDKMSEFSTPGLVLFGQLPGPKDGLAAFSDMLFTAERLASLLNGELQDESHSVLSKQTIEHMRGRILEHRRQVQLALSKR
ncbi:cell division protein ZipA [Sedimenticola selenatireducens]|uniref:Cell division protein ZipA n=1 Tax=Sedimenticola selenatireducens TaxID=191960 RepID=A0A558E1F7_9GAMM|nr:cell division protein ZipA [Sedimenticola selenatireducens]TVO79017.1 cell division protein ZipA [Sedimenticola selenatireducens]TVT67191.1 MAG: cell division protein ZipA [Sedimenticola selenatireducens]